jgi:hypothetical protein
MKFEPILPNFFVDDGDNDNKKESTTGFMLLICEARQAYEVKQKQFQSINMFLEIFFDTCSF